MIMNHTTPSINNAIQEYKKCAGKKCNKPATTILRINFIKKKGWFCDRCANDLITQDLAEQTGEHSVYISSQQEKSV